VEEVIKASVGDMGNRTVSKAIKIIVHAEDETIWRGDIPIWAAPTTLRFSYMRLLFLSLLRVHDIVTAVDLW
jgi:hypothetical protein